MEHDISEKEVSYDYNSHLKDSRSQNIASDNYETRSNVILNKTKI